MKAATRPHTKSPEAAELRAYLEGAEYAVQVAAARAARLADTTYADAAGIDLTYQQAKEATR